MKKLLPLLLAAALLAGCAPASPPANTFSPTPEVPEAPLPETSVPTVSPAETPPAETLPTETEPAPLPTPGEDDLVRVADYIPSIAQGLAYATNDNFTGQVIYNFSNAYLRYGAVRRLAQAQELLAEQGLGLKIWDGFRPLSAQEALWEICPDPRYVSNPETGKCSHCRGSAVDVTLIDLATGQELDMPTGFDDFTSRADRDYSDCTETEQANALLLEQIMAQCGFSGYWAEWWHYSIPEEYPIDEDFDPAAVSRWVVDCEEYVNLRSSPSIYADSLAQLPDGTSLTLQGWMGKFAYVSCHGQEGYVMAGYLVPEEIPALTIGYTDCYTYEMLQEDLKELTDRFSGQAETEVIGKTASGKTLSVLRLGAEDADLHILLHGAIHGREHMTGWLMMALGEDWLNNGIKGHSNVCIHIIPMVNPDGVEISQSGQLPSELEPVYQWDLEQGYTDEKREDYARLWKANGLGEDINRNFDAGWESTSGRAAPSSQRYKGETPFTVSEATALRDYTLRYSFDATLSYHASGSILYYQYGTDKTVNDRSESLARAVERVTGYPLVESDDLDAAGYKDWAMEELGIPSLTVEVGCEEAPLALRESFSIFVRNRSVLEQVILWLESHA